MDFDEWAAAVVAAVPANGDEVLYDTFLAALPPVAFVSLPRHLGRLRQEKTLALRVRFDKETLTTGIFVSLPQEGGE